MRPIRPTAPSGQDPLSSSSSILHDLLQLEEAITEDLAVDHDLLAAHLDLILEGAIVCLARVEEDAALIARGEDLLRRLGRFDLLELVQGGDPR